MNLGYNKIKDIDKLSESLKFNSSLIKLNLKGNKNIYNYDNFFECLKYNKSLCYLKFNYYLYNDFEKLLEILNDNITLTDIDYNDKYY